MVLSTSVEHNAALIDGGVDNGGVKVLRIDQDIGGGGQGYVCDVQGCGRGNRGGCRCGHVVVGVATAEVVTVVEAAAAKVLYDTVSDSQCCACGDQGCES